MNDDYEGLVRRMERGIGIWGVIGAVGAWVGWDGLTAVGVGTGAVAAWANFRWLERVFSRPTPARAAMFGFRLAALAVLGYAMLKIFAVNHVAFLAGLLTAVVAAMSETVYQLIYARNS